MLEIELKCYDSLKCMGIQLGLCPLHSQVIMQSIVSVQQFQSVPFLLLTHFATVTNIRSLHYIII